MFIYCLRFVRTPQFFIILFSHGTPKTYVVSQLKNVLAWTSVIFCFTALFSGSVQ